MTATTLTPTYGLTHIALAVKDLCITKKFYQAVCDMEVMYDEVDFLQLTTPGAHDVLVFKKNLHANGNSGGIAHFGFRLGESKSISIMEKKILDAGGRIVSQGEFVPGSPYIFLKDPDGYEIEIWYELLP